MHVSSAHSLCLARVLRAAGAHSTFLSPSFRSLAARCVCVRNTHINSFPPQSAPRQSRKNQIRRRTKTLRNCIRSLRRVRFNVCVASRNFQTIVLQSCRLVICFPGAAATREKSGRPIERSWLIFIVARRLRSQLSSFLPAWPRRLVGRWRRS